MEGSDELDRVIDGALPDYSGTEPLAGLEERILNRVRVVKDASRRRLVWAFALVAVAAVIVVVIVVRGPRVSVPKNDDAVVATAHVGSAVAVEKPPRGEPKRSVRARAPRQRVLPKRDLFPTPAPMTDEERALVAFVSQRPSEAQEIFADLRKRSVEPIAIEPIQISPLQNDGAQ
jgi:hypothetical protein